jgi:hypothetical protein
MSKKKKIKFESSEDYQPWKRMGVPKKSGHGGLHRDHRQKRKRTRSGRDKNAIEESLEAWDDNAQDTNYK